MLLTFFKYLFSFQRSLSFLNMQISQVMMSYSQPNFCSYLMKKDISANLYQKCLILCSKILLKVLHNMKSWQHTVFQISPKLKAFLATLSMPFSYLQMVPRIYDPAGI